jgi:hypothetical protein
MERQEGTCKVVLFKKDTLPDLFKDMINWLDDNKTSTVWEVLVSLEDKDRDSNEPVYGWIYHSGDFEL